jgi:hypothetical protein
MMKNIFEVNDEEKSRILGMHQSATSKQYLIEGPQVIRMTIQIPISKNHNSITNNNQQRL